MRAKTTYRALLSAAMLLAGCGGGGSGESTRAGAGDIEGAYEGSISSGYTHSTVILEDGRYYAIYGQETDGVSYIVGLIQGDGVANNGSFTSTNLRDYVFDGSVYSGVLSASYREDSGFSGSISDGTNTATFTGMPLGGNPYNYKSAANLSNITGSWTLTTLQNESITMNIQSGGSFTASASGGCSFDGTILPRASGKNVFDVNLTFGPAPCELAGQSANGIALEYLIEGQRQFIIAGTTTDRISGTVMFGAR